MKPLLLMAFDDRRLEVGNVAVEAAEAFATANGMDMELIRAIEFANPMMAQVTRVWSALESTRAPWILYADADVLFRRGAQLNEFMTFMPMVVSKDDNGICAGLYFVRRQTETLKLMRTWSTLGICDNANHEHAQMTLKLLMGNFAWIRALVGLISRRLVSSPNDQERGSMAHHYWAAKQDQTELAKRMRADWEANK